MSNKELFECYRQFQSALDYQYTDFFLKYTQEEYDDAYRNKYDPKNPYIHLIKTFFADVLSLQVNNLSLRPYCHFYFLPILMILKDNKNRGAFWKLNHPEIVTKSTMINNGRYFDNFVENFITIYKSKDDMENGIIDFNTGIFPDLFLGAGNKGMSDLDVDSDIKHFKEYKWQSIVCNPNLKEISALDSNDDEVCVGNFYKTFLMSYNDKPDKKGEKKEINLLVVFFVSNLNHGAERCTLSICETMLKDTLIHESLQHLFDKLFYISVNLEKEVLSSKEHDDLIVARQKESLFANIQDPLTNMIGHLTSINSMIAYIDRQLNPPWVGLLNLSNIEAVTKLYVKNAPITYGNNLSFKGYHNFEDEYSSENTDQNVFLKHVPDYFLSLIERVDKNLKVAKIESTDQQDILVLMSNLLMKKVENKGKYDLLRFLKLMVYDIQDNGKAITFLQLLFYALLGSKSGTVSYYVTDKIAEDNCFYVVDTVGGLNKFTNTQIYKEAVNNYRNIHLNKSNQNYPTVTMAGHVSPGEFCGALAGLIGEELQGHKKSVIFQSIHIVSLDKGKHIGITIECNGTFEDNSLVKKIASDGAPAEILYHGMRNTLDMIERAVGAKRRFEVSDAGFCLHPFVFFSNGKKTIIRIILGDIFATPCSYQPNDFSKRKDTT